MTNSDAAGTSAPITGWLVSSAGRRGELVKILESTPVGASPVPVCAVDMTPLSAAGQLADTFALVPRCTDASFLPRVQTICQEAGANVIIPTIDPEIMVYANARGQLAEAGITCWVSSPQVAALGWDKWQLYQWCQARGLPVPRTFEIRDESAARRHLSGPVIAKPRSGSASIGVKRYPTIGAVPFAELPESYIVQTCVPGAEVTIDFAVSKAGELLGYCPRKRLEVRAGEVSKAITIAHPAISELMEHFAALLPGAYGMLNLQVFFNEADGEVSILELNPRFGGGFPLAHAAGVGLLEALIADMHAPHAPAAPRTADAGFVMLRYDAHVLAKAETLGLA